MPHETPSKKANHQTTNSTPATKTPHLMAGPIVNLTPILTTIPSWILPKNLFRPPSLPSFPPRVFPFWAAGGGAFPPLFLLLSSPLLFPLSPLSSPLYFFPFSSFLLFLPLFASSFISAPFFLVSGSFPVLCWVRRALPNGFRTASVWSGSHRMLFLDGSGFMSNGEVGPRRLVSGL